MDTGEQLAVGTIDDHLVSEANRYRVRASNLEFGLRRIVNQYHKKLHATTAEWEDCRYAFCREVHSMLQDV